MRGIDLFLWWTIQGLGIITLLYLPYTGQWRPMKWFTIMNASNVTTDLLLSRLFVICDPHEYVFAYSICHLITMGLQCAAFLDLLFLGRNLNTYASKMGMTLLCYWLLEWALMLKVALTTLNNWYLGNHYIQFVYIFLELLCYDGSGESIKILPEGINCVMCEDQKETTPTPKPNEPLDDEQDGPGSPAPGGPPQ